MSDEELKICSLREFLSAELPPEPAESAYRRGYSDGYARAIRDLATAHRLGYSRTMHALDVLATFWRGVLYKWHLNARGSNPSEEWPPSIKIEKWREITRKVFERDNYTCFHCGRSKEKDGVQIVCDHVDAVANGGGNELANLVASCKECNRAKSNQPIENFNRRAYWKLIGIDVE